MTALEQLVVRMPVLAQAQHPLGLRADRAAEFSALVQSTGDAGVALRTAGGDGPLGDVVAHAKAPDAVGVLVKLIGPVGELATLRRALKGAGAYPLTLLASFAIAAWAVFAISLPALVVLGADPTRTRAVEVGVLAVCIGLLLAVSAITATGLRVPGFTRGPMVLDRALALEAAAALVEGKVPLDAAFAAAAVGATGPVRAASEALARAFAAGAPPGPAQPLMDGDASAILQASAQRGVAGTVLRALAEQALLEARREIPAEVRKVHGVSLFLAGVAVLALAVGWYQTYLQAVIE